MNIFDWWFYLVVKALPFWEVLLFVLDFVFVVEECDVIAQQWG
jgi:hypothetical protein